MLHVPVLSGQRCRYCMARPAFIHTCVHHQVCYQRRAPAHAANPCTFSLNWKVVGTTTQLAKFVLSKACLAFADGHTLTRSFSWTLRGPSPSLRSKKLALPSLISSVASFVCSFFHSLHAGWLRSSLSKTLHGASQSRWSTM